MQGATQNRERPALHIHISIRAPHAGCDWFIQSSSSVPGRFQSTHPMRGATKVRHKIKNVHLYFNPRTPCGVRHEPSIKRLTKQQNFNPRTPCGVRRLPELPDRQARHFNPRTPCGVRLIVSFFGLCLRKISIHAPHAGCDRQTQRHRESSSQNFNPRTPCGVRHAKKDAKKADSAISIHAPHAGCDSAGNASQTPPSLFQSTHPMRGATLEEQILTGQVTIFQSTHPMRGATSSEPCE